MFGRKLLWKSACGFFWWKIWVKMPYLISLNHLLFKNIAYIESFVFFLSVSVCLCENGDVTDAARPADQLREDRATQLMDTER